MYVERVASAYLVFSNFLAIVTTLFRPPAVLGNNGDPPPRSGGTERAGLRHTYSMIYSEKCENSNLPDTNTTDPYLALRDPCAQHETSITKQKIWVQINLRDLVEAMRLKMADKIVQQRRHATMKFLV